MDKPACHVRHLRKTALSGYVSEVDAIATGGHYLDPDTSGFFDASAAHDLCVACVNCGSVVSSPGVNENLVCPDCGHDEFHVVQTIAPPPRRSTYTPLVPPIVPPPPSPPRASDDAGDSPIVSPWARWAARLLDFWVGAFAAAFLIGYLLESMGFDTDGISEVGWMILTIPSGLVLDAFVHHLFGWTLGKWLFAVKIRHRDGGGLKFGEYLKRNFLVFVQGFGLSLPIVNLVTFIIQYNRLRSGKSASYDEGKNVRIVRAKHSAIRTFFAIVALVVLFLVLASLNE